MILADSNLLIYAAHDPNGPVAHWIATELPAISVVSRVEVLGYHALKAGEEDALQSILSALQSFLPNLETFERAIVLRKQRKMGLADALIVATAMQHELQLATHNTKDFEWVDDLKLFDPLADKEKP